MDQPLVAGSETDKIIAKLLGYKVQRYDAALGPFQMGNNFYSLVDKDGKDLDKRLGKGCSDLVSTEFLAWDHCPAFTYHEDNTALELLKILVEEGRLFSWFTGYTPIDRNPKYWGFVDQRPGPYSCQVTAKGAMGKSAVGWAETLPLAICTALGRLFEEKRGKEIEYFG